MEGIATGAVALRLEVRVFLISIVLGSGPGSGSVELGALEEGAGFEEAVVRALRRGAMVHAVRA